jgi:hypothetical protein
MNDALLVRRLERLGERAEDGDGLFNTHCACGPTPTRGRSSARRLARPGGRRRSVSRNQRRRSSPSTSSITRAGILPDSSMR